MARPGCKPTVSGRDTDELELPSNPGEAVRVAEEEVRRL